MPNLIINRLIYSIETENGKYGANVPFHQGLNIIYGPNSVGKTSIVTGIIYGLGSEKGLGIFKSDQNPFKPEFYKSIDGNPILKSYLILEISNGVQEFSIFRYIKGGNTDIAAVKETKARDFFTTNDHKRYIVNGEGVFSENGFQKFIFDFLGLDIVELPTYDQKFSKLYLENILPLFFVEQRAGWSQIQARQVTRYNIRDVKKVAFEYIMGLDKFSLHLIEIKKKELEAQIKKLSEDLEKKEENLLIIANANKIDGILVVNSGSIGKTSIYDYIRYLSDKYNVESKNINSITSQNKDYEDVNSKLRENLKRLDYELRTLNNRIEKISTEIDGYQNYLERIQKNKYKNRQLKKIQELSIELNITSCPVCESPLNRNIDDECHLCHSDVRKKLSSPEENLAFLEDEENTFKKVIRQRNLDKKKLEEIRNGQKDKILLYEKQLDHQTQTFAGKEFAVLKEKILEVDSMYKDFERYKRIDERWQALNPTREEIIRLDVQFTKLKDKINQYLQTSNDFTILKTIKDNIHKNLKALGIFKSNQNLINEIKIDENDNYSPYLDNYDIYNISSSSDNIRIILSYYLSLLQTSITFKENEKIKFPNILILDEPKQQNLDNDSLINCVEEIEKIPSNEGQIILTTYSELESDRDRLKKYINFEMKSKTDYLLKKLND
ncbi:AAA family ATPase [Flavobacterium sp. DSR3-2]|uniref:AAA family ATPase n=1 Tax=Flavobacterium sp. DSR3-2 TaxID=2804634 RepID=UPI003CFA2B35